VIENRISPAVIIMYCGNWYQTEMSFAHTMVYVVKSNCNTVTTTDD